MRPSRNAMIVGSVLALAGVISPALADDVQLSCDAYDPGDIDPLCTSSFFLRWGEGPAEFPPPLCEPVEAPSDRSVVPPAGPPHGSGAATPLTGTLPALRQSFEGANQAGSDRIQPDTMGAVGPAHFMEILNSIVTIYSKDGGEITNSETLESFFSCLDLSQHPTTGAEKLADPRVIFYVPPGEEPDEGRWIVIALDALLPHHLVLAISVTNDPTGAFHYLRFALDPAGGSQFRGDYPTLGVDATGIYIAAETRTDPITMTIWAIDKAPLIEDPPSIPTITACRGLHFNYAIQPAHTFGTAPGEYIIGKSTEWSLRIYRVDPPDPPSTSPNAYDTGTVSVPTFFPPPAPPSLGDLDGNTGVSTLGDRLMMSVYRDGSLWTTHCVNVNGRAAIRWYEIDPADNTLIQWGTVADASLHYYMPSLMLNDDGHMLMGFSGSDEDQYIGTYFTGRRHDDPYGDMAPPVLLKTAEPEIDASYTVNAWGDYSYTSLDPIDGQTLWTVQEYALARCQNPNVPEEQISQWGTWIASFTFDCNDNDIDDHQDIINGSPDCNGNMVPDECEIDSDIPGGFCRLSCKPDNCGDVTCDPDCDNNGRPDSCDFDDCNENCIEDQCDVDCFAPGCDEKCDQANNCESLEFPGQFCGAADDCNSDNMPDECQDCNDNGIADSCDIAAGTSQDCSGNGIPDECEIVDCNTNGVADSCDIDVAYQGGCAVQPCSVDCDVDGLPDECEPLWALALPGAGFEVTKHRYLSIGPNTNSQCVALKVELTAMRRCEDDLERACTENSDCTTGVCVQHGDVGSFWWVQAPQNEPLGCLPGNECGDDDWFARVDTAFHSQVWDFATLHVGDCEIVPVATYEIRACLPPDGTVCSAPLTIGTIEQPFISPGSRVNYGDVAGPVSGTEFTPPDGIANITDVSAYILTAQNYGTPNTPQTHPTWVDLKGLGDGSPPNYILAVPDLQTILQALQGNKWTGEPGNLNPGQCPECCSSPPPPGGNPIAFVLVARDDIIGSGDDVYIDVYMDAPSSVDIGAYEIRLKVTGGTAGSFELHKASPRLCVGGADGGRPCDDASDCADPGTCEVPADYVFAQDTFYKAASRVTKQLSNAKEAGHVTVQGQKYLATYRFQPTGGATGVFTFEIEDDYNLSFFNDADGVLLASQGGETEVVGVGVDCLGDGDCEQIACQTGTCVSNACVYDNAPQGTPCDDGQFCTATDECDGNGACVGSGSACGNPLKPQCCEGEQTCICSTCPCSEQ